jgi:hypothetical protein
LRWLWPRPRDPPPSGTSSCHHAIHHTCRPCSVMVLVPMKSPRRGGRERLG